MTQADLVEQAHQRKTTCVNLNITLQVDLVELKHVLTSIGERMSNEEFAELMKIGKISDRKEFLNYQEFVQQGLKGIDLYS